MSHTAQGLPATSPAMPASYLTHELRAPVTAIRLGLELLQEQAGGRLDAGERQLLDASLKSAIRLATLINDIMDYAKSTAGRLTLEKRACDAAALISEAAAGLGAWARSKNIRIVEGGGGLVARLNADPARIVQVLTNLISNALKFTPSGGRVAIGVEQKAYMAEFSVKDTGPGIPGDKLESIFEAFEQATHLGSKVCEGTGLGLTLSRKLIALHGGRIWAQSRPGEGAAFFFTVPLAR
jgi:signal transduction histidine kinase